MSTEMGTKVETKETTGSVYTSTEHFCTPLQGLEEIGKKIEEPKQKKKEAKLKYIYVFDENGNLVDATTLVYEDRLNHTYHIEGFDDKGNKVDIPVYPVIGKVKRPHFKTFPRKDGESAYYVNIKGYNETIIHKLARQLFLEGKIRFIRLPSYKLELSNGIVINKPAKFDSLFDIKGEQILKTPDEERIKVDILASAFGNRQLAIEIYVTHAVDKHKLDKIQQIGIDTIEIDLSSLISDNRPAAESIKSDILSLITLGEAIHWISNKEQLMVADWEKNRITYQINPSRHHQGRDGGWYIWAADNLDKLTHCPYRDQLDDKSNCMEHRWLCETRHCGKCERATVLYTNGVPSKLMCNQSEVSNAEILRMVTEI